MRDISLENMPIKLSTENKLRLIGGYGWFLKVHKNIFRFLGGNEYPNILEPHI